MQALFDAIKSGDAAAVTSLLDHDSALAEAKDERGLSPLAFAIYNRQPAIAQLLETRGTVLDVFTAAMLGRAGRITELVSENRSLARAYSHDGWTALHLAVFFGHQESAVALLAKGAEARARSTNPMQNTPLHAAAAGGHAALAKLLLDRGADVNARQHGGWTALHAAAQNGDAVLAQLLIDGGADIAIRAENNQSALDLALTKGHRQIVELLERQGAALQ
ncbi:MAG: ankyrin repeat domain-containing protein [Bryobacteraceae bacterium]